MRISKLNDYFIKNRCNRVSVFAVLFFFISLNTYAQDGIFSQYYSSSLYLNPALAGLQPSISINSNYRLQWLSVSPYTLSQVSLIYPIINKAQTNPHHLGGIGISLFQEKSGTQGSFVNQGANISFSYNLPLTRDRSNFLSFGLQSGLGQQQIDIGKYEWGSQYSGQDNDIDQSLLTNQYQLNGRKSYMDVSAGALWYFNSNEDLNDKKLSGFVGASFYHLNNPNQSLIENVIVKIPTIFKIHSGVKIPLTQRVSISPNLIFAQQNTTKQYNGGMYISYDVSGGKKRWGDSSYKTELIAGAFYRVKDAFILMGGLNTKFFTLGLSYDMNTSPLKKYTGGKGAYEISLSLRFPKNLKVSRYDTPRI